MSSLKRITCFTNDAIGIDPAGCGCTDCIVGDSIPADHAGSIQELIEEHFNEGREILNRDYYNIVIYLDEEGNGAWEYHEGENLDILPMDTFRYEEYNALDRNPIVIIHPPAHRCETCQSGESIPADTSAKFDEAYLRHRTQAASLYNESGHILLVAKGYTEPVYTVSTIDAHDEYSIEVLYK